MSSTPYDISALVEIIKTASNDLGKNNREARRQCLDAARTLTFALETPVEAILRNCWAEVGLPPSHCVSSVLILFGGTQQGHHSALRAGIDLKLFEKLDERNGEAKSSAELAKMTSADPVLLGRLLKHLAAMGSIYETGPNEYISTPFSRALREPIYRDAYPTMMGICGPAFFALPEHLSKTHYKNPDNPADGAFQLGWDTSDHFFGWVSQRPDRLTQFQNHMAGYRTGRPSWMDPDFYPVEKNLVEGATTGDDAVFLVDVGGGKGHDLQELHRKHPTLPGKLVLQELPGVVEEAQSAGLGPNIVAMPHDFFTTQPITGARAYYMHSCLHDWPDAQAAAILARLAPALTRGYSKLLINENVIPDRGAHWVSTALDMVMMATFSASERTAEHWRALLLGAGFRVVRVWDCEPGAESLIEAELA
ncbi:hypothetical protein MMC27_004164 [Xylographa pallens]|nr:hypothetical protein [Xylographa pallens]